VPLVLLIVLGLNLAGSATDGFAQTARDESVQQRPRPDFDPEGLYFDDLVDGVGRAVGLVRRDQPRPDSTSSVIVYPKLLLGTYYDDNVLRSPNSKRGDFAHTGRASLDINSDRDEHGFEFGGYAEAGFFDRFVSENYHQYGGYAGGFLVPTDESRLNAKFSAERLRQPREEIGAGTAELRPTVYHLLTGTVKGEYQNADWLLAPSGTFKRYTYEPNQPVVLGSEFDRNEYTAAFRIGHAINSGSAVFIEPQVNKRSYDLAVSPDDGFRHDSSGYQVLAGARLDFSSVTYAEFAGGWLHQSYVDPAFKSLSGPALLATGVWNPRDWITLSLEAGRQITESVLAGVSGIEVTYVQSTFDYEIDYDWLASANLGYTTADYRGSTSGTGPARSDNILRYGLATRYLLNRRVALGLAWTAFDRSSNTPGAELTFNQYMATVQLQW
jgi:hypothetical protein